MYICVIILVMLLYICVFCVLCFYKATNIDCLMMMFLQDPFEVCRMRENVLSFLGCRIMLFISLKLDS